MAELNINDNDKRVPKGLQNKGQTHFNCADCGEHLLVLQLTAVAGDDSGKVLTRVVVKCGECQGFSYVQKVCGQFHAGAVSDDMSFDILEDNTGAPEADVFFIARKK